MYTGDCQRELILPVVDATLSDYHFGFVFGRCCVRIAAQIPVTLIDMFAVFLSPSEVCLKADHGYFRLTDNMIILKWF